MVQAYQFPIQHSTSENQGEGREIGPVVNNSKKVQELP